MTTHIHNALQTVKQEIASQIGTQNELICRIRLVANSNANELLHRLAEIVKTTRQFLRSVIQFEGQIQELESINTEQLDRFTALMVQADAMAGYLPILIEETMAMLNGEHHE